MKFFYIAHPIKGDVDGNLARLRRIIKSINTNPKYATTVPFVQYYADVVSMDDNVPAERQRGLQNGLEILSRKGAVDEMLVMGDKITEGMKQEIFKAFEMGIPVGAFDNLINQLENIRDQWKNR